MTEYVKKNKQTNKLIQLSIFRLSKEYVLSYRGCNQQTLFCPESKNTKHSLIDIYKVFDLFLYTNNRDTTLYLQIDKNDKLGVGVTN